MKFSFALLFLALTSCSGSGKIKAKIKQIDDAVVLKSFKNVVEGVNNSYFEIKSGNYFDSYRLLFDNVKNTRYAGTYSSVEGNDTITLHFFHSKGLKFLGSRALISGDKITFFK